MKPNEIINELTNMALEYAAIDVCNPKRIDALSSAINLIQSLQPRPIEEAPRDEWLLVECINERYKGRYFVVRYIMLGDHEDWQIFPGYSVGRNWFETFIPLSAIQALMEGGE